MASIPLSSEGAARVVACGTSTHKQLMSSNTSSNANGEMQDVSKKTGFMNIFAMIKQECLLSRTLDSWKLEGKRNRNKRATHSKGERGM